MKSVQERVQQTVQFLRQFIPRPVSTGLVLGSGLGGFVHALQVDEVIPYAEIPHFPCSTAPGHAGRLILGRAASNSILVLQGRCHLYEGHRVEEVTYPVRVFRELGVGTLILSCAAGGLAPGLAVGDLLLIEEQMNLQFRAPQLAGCGPNFRSWLYDPDLVEELSALLRRHAIPGRRGSYVAVSGPTYETRAEQRFLRMFATAVGMSTVLEASLAHELGMRVCAIATITNLCDPDRPEQTDGDHVIQAATRAEPHFRELVLAFLRELGKPGISQKNCIERRDVFPDPAKHF